MRHLTKWITVLLAAAIAVASVGCSGNESPSNTEATQPKAGSGPISSQSEASTPSTSAKDGSDYASESVSPTPDAAAETAVFALGVQGGEEKTMRVGDTIGDWALSDLKITYFTEEQKIRMLESSFTGEVTLTGTISRNGLVELGYDFMVADEDMGKMPRYISSENAEKDYFMFMLDIPDGLANAPSLEHGETLECKITISSYHFTFAYMTAPSGATVTKIAPL